MIVKKSTASTWKEYRQVAKELGLIYLFGRWGLSTGSKLPEGHRRWKFRIFPLDGWTSYECEIVEAIANDPDWKVGYKK